MGKVREIAWKFEKMAEQKNRLPQTNILLINIVLLLLRSLLNMQLSSGCSY